jgi:manganese transport protein
MLNAAIMIMAADAFNGIYSNIASISDAYKTLVPLFGAGAGIVFVITCYHLVFPLQL